MSIYQENLKRAENYVSTIQSIIEDLKENKNPNWEDIADSAQLFDELKMVLDALSDRVFASCKDLKVSGSAYVPATNKASLSAEEEFDKFVLGKAHEGADLEGYEVTIK